MKTEAIKQIPIKDIMDRLGVDYRPAGYGEFSIVEGGKITSGRKFNTSKNMVHDFSKDRPSGDTFGFVKLYLNLTDDKYVFERFTEHFDTPGIEQKKNIMQVWHGLKELEQKHIDYLGSRSVDYEKIKDCVKLYNDGIACLIYEGEVAKGMMARTLHKEHSKRFVALSGYSTKGIYKHQLDREKDYVIVVEGLMDFLTLRQHDTNIVGLKSSESGIEQIISLADKYQIYYVSDNDEAGKQSLEKLKGIRYKRFDLSLFEAKDINELYTSTGGYKDIIEVIKDGSKYIAPITSTIEKFEKFQAIIQKQGKLGIDGPFPTVYNLCSGVIPGKVYTIGAYSNTGKSRFAYHHVAYFLKQGKNVAMISLEVDEALCFSYIASAYEGIYQNELIAGKKPSYDNYRNLIIRDDLFSLGEIIDFIKGCKCDLVFIDFVQNIHEKGSAYERHATIAQTIQKTAIQTNCTIYSIAQVSNTVGRDMQNGIDTLPSLKGAGEYYASSDVVMMLTKVEGNLYLNLVKNKYGPNMKKWKMAVDWGKNCFTLGTEITNEDPF